MPIPVGKLKPADKKQLLSLRKLLGLQDGDVAYRKWKERQTAEPSVPVDPNIGLIADAVSQAYGDTKRVTGFNSSGYVVTRKGKQMIVTPMPKSRARRKANTKNRATRKRAPRKK